MAQSFTVHRSDLRRTRITDDSTTASTALSAGSIRLHVDLFALTSNNVTYATFGDAMRYWEFFPADVGGEGRIPVWGFANVVESKVEGVAVGERFYGFYPLSAVAILEAEEVTERGFIDGAAHRRTLPRIYNQYLRCAADRGYDREHEPHIALLRPLFGTGFLIDDFLAERAFFGADMVVLSSASSKTAYATAFCLSERRGTPGAPKIVGLTSPGNVAFTRGLGCYDEVLTYDAIDTLPRSPAVYVDFCGSAKVRRDVHTHLGDQLTHSAAVGGTHWQERGSPEVLPGPLVTLFFAPTQMKQRAADWGALGLADRVAAAWRAFLKPVTNPASPWLRIVRGRGVSAALGTYLALLDGRVPAEEGHVISL